MTGTANWVDEAITALARSESVARNDATSIAIRGVGWALLALREQPAIKEMLDHCAEFNHPLQLRLVDTDVFAVHCQGEADQPCRFHTEWRT